MTKFGLTDTFSPSLESSKPAIFKTGTTFDCSFKKNSTNNCQTQKYFNLVEAMVDHVIPYGLISVTLSVMFTFYVTLHVYEAISITISQ